jgi:hypothetical protein
MNEMKQQMMPRPDTFDEMPAPARLADKVMLWLFVGVFALFGAMLVGELLGSLWR